MSAIAVGAHAILTSSDVGKDIVSGLVYTVTHDVSHLVMGLLLVLGASFWSASLNRIREFGLKHKV